VPLINCPHCGKTMFRISGWADLDHCLDCGKPLAGKEIDRGGWDRASTNALNEARRAVRMHRASGVGDRRPDLRVAVDGRDLRTRSRRSGAPIGGR
jgi:hypothetical protein